MKSNPPTTYSLPVYVWDVDKSTEIPAVTKTSLVKITGHDRRKVVQAVLKLTAQRPEVAIDIDGAIVRGSHWWEETTTIEPQGSDPMSDFIDDSASVLESVLARGRKR